MENLAQALGQPIVIAGPCVAESYEQIDEVATHLVQLSKEVGFHLVFKASFDKANRTSVKSYRGPGMETTLRWFADLKDKHRVEVLTDIHETPQVAPVAKVCDWLQIPAFLCRQTDLIVAAIESGRKVNIKKGQFLAPEAVQHIVSKAREVTIDHPASTPLRLAITERGTTFGYSGYVVDMRAFPIMAKTGAHLIYDITHSVQRPNEGSKDGSVAAGDRHLAPALARAATATGYLDGYFLEVHPNPKAAKSDGATVLSFPQSALLLKQIIPLWRHSLAFHEIDREFQP